MPSIRRHHHMTSGFTKNMGGKRGRETPTLFVYKQRIIHETKAKKNLWTAQSFVSKLFSFSVPSMHHFYNSNLFEWNIFHHQSYKNEAIFLLLRDDWVPKEFRQYLHFTMLWISKMSMRWYDHSRYKCWVDTNLRNSSVKFIADNGLNLGRYECILELW